LGGRQLVERRTGEARTGESENDQRDRRREPDPTRWHVHSLRPKPEKLLKSGGLRAAFAFAGVFACPVAAAAQAAGGTAPAPLPLLTGVVRDQTGAAPPAHILVRDAAGRVVGSAVTGRDGTFAALLSAAPAHIEVDCLHCAPLRVASDGEPAVLIVTRFGALDGGPPTGDDLAALPYRDPAQAVALAPYVVAVQSPAGPVAALSDRGLGGGDGLVLDDGVPVYDPATGDSGLYGFPGRSLGAVQLAPASRAFSYGSYAGGGTFALDPLASEAPLTTAFDSGWGFALAEHVRAGAVDGLFGGSSDPDGVLRERFDLAAAAGLGGGTLRAVASVASQTSGDVFVADDRSRALASVEYERVSQRASTDVSLDALESRSAYTLPGSDEIYTSAADAFDLRLRVERPAWVTYSYGALLRGAGASYGDQPYVPPGTNYSNALAYVEAAHDGPAGFDAGLGVERVAARAAGASAAETVALPSLAVNAALGADFAVRAGTSTSLRAPLPFEVADYTAGAFTLQRDGLQEIALDFDDRRRFRLGATLFDENVTGLDAHRLNGLGLAAAWQIAPRLSLRAWTLHDALNPGTQSPTVAPGDLGTTLARAVAWLSYEAPGGLRVDLLARGARDASQRESDLDADVVAPLQRGVALTAGTERERGRRRSYAGIRIR